MHFVRSTETSPPSVCSSNWSTRRNGAPGSSSKPHVGSEAGAWPLGHAIAAHEARNQLAVWQNFACRKRHPRDGRTLHLFPPLPWTAGNDTATLNFRYAQFWLWTARGPWGGDARHVANGRRTCTISRRMMRENPRRLGASCDCLGM